MDKTKVCSKCKIDKPKSEYTKRKDRKNGLYSQCKSCKNNYFRTDKGKAVHKRYKLSLKGKEKESRYKRSFRGKEVERIRCSKYKLLVLSHYSIFNMGYMCAVPGCLVSDPDMLCIDHINNNGKKHRDELGLNGGYRFYIWLVKNKYPPGFQVLCHNHNFKKEIEYYRKSYEGSI